MLWLIFASASAALVYSTVHEITADNFDNLRFATNNFWFVAFTGYGRDVSSDMAEAAAKFPERVSFGIAETKADDELWLRYDIQRVTTFMLFSPYDKPQVVESVNNADTIIAYVEAVLHRHGFDLVIDQVKTEDTLKSKCEAADVCVVIVIPMYPEEEVEGEEEQPNSWQEEIEDYISAATIYWRKVKDDSVNFLWIAQGDLPSFEEAISLDTDAADPSVIALSYKSNQFVSKTDAFSLKLLSSAYTQLKEGQDYKTLESWGTAGQKEEL